MGKGQRFRQLFGSRGAPAEGDPGAMVEAGVVQLAEGPMAVERLRDQGIDAVGIESVDPVTGVRSYMRIMVRQSDLAAADHALAEPDDQHDAGEALEDLSHADDDDELAAAEEMSQQAMSELFLAADRLAGRPGDVELVTEIERLLEAVVDGPPPFGVEPLAWERVASLSAAVVSADGLAEDDEEDAAPDEEAGDEEADDEEAREDAIQVAARALRDFLRSYV